MLSSDRYMAVGCDLRNTTKLSKILEEKLEIVSYTVLCVAKVSSTYMDIDAADALIKWAAQYNDVTDCQMYAVLESVLG